eukprot:352461-Rhodomonas_salina.2
MTYPGQDKAEREELLPQRQQERRDRETAERDRERQRERRREEREREREREVFTSGERQTRSAIGWTVPAGVRHDSERSSVVCGSSMPWVSIGDRACPRSASEIAYALASIGDRVARA